MKHNLKSLLLILSLTVLVTHCELPGTVTKWSGQTMGTFYHVSVYGPAMDKASHLQIHDGIDSVLQSMNKQMNTWDPESEISRFNRLKESDTLEISSEFIRVLEISKSVWKESGGAFDPTVGPLVDLWGFGAGSKEKKAPDLNEIKTCLEYTGFDLIGWDNTKLTKNDSRVRLDLAAVAKGFGVDAVSRYLKSRGFMNHLVEIGGEVFACGKVKNRSWRLGIDRPDDNALPGENLSSIISISGQGVATSGDYRNFYMDKGRRISHTINPKTGEPVTHTLASVTIIAPDCARADAIATACIVMGNEAPDWLESLDSVEGYFIFRQDSVTIQEKMTNGFGRFLVK
ncbi:MAG: FAD:protein FMN transferase [Candidatus Marinimicrobia bacterium]|nr:FAD:protein FMN transferase [Candidatus Neomarinimicrobiota bacterium]